MIAVEKDKAIKVMGSAMMVFESIVILLTIPVAVAVEDIPGGSQQTYSFVFECEGAAKPSCVAEVIFRSYE